MECGIMHVLETSIWQESSSVLLTYCLVNEYCLKKKKPNMKLLLHFFWFPDFMPSGIPKSFKREILNQQFVRSDVTEAVQRTRIPFSCKFQGFRICFHYSEEWKQPLQTFLQMEIVMKCLFLDQKPDLFSSSSLSSGHKWQGNPRQKSFSRNVCQNWYVDTFWLW